MLRESEGSVYVPPRSLPLLEQFDLVERILVKRWCLKRRQTWDEIAEAEGAPKRTIQQFYADWLDGLTKDWNRRTPPMSRPLHEQLDLATRIILRRCCERETWDEIATAEGVPKRTLQHFFNRWMGSLRKKRSATSIGTSLARRVDLARAISAFERSGA